jgi:hypothetical protein
MRKELEKRVQRDVIHGFIFTTIFIYFVFMVVIGELNPLEWHWLFRLIAIGFWLGWNISTWEQIIKKAKKEDESEELNKPHDHDCREPKTMIIETSNHSGSHLTTYRCSVCNKIVHQVVK